MIWIVVILRLKLILISKELCVQLAGRLGWYYDSDPRLWTPIMVKEAD
jgi:hypothetical protein